MISDQIVYFYIVCPIIALVIYIMFKMFSHFKF